MNVEIAAFKHSFGGRHHDLDMHIYIYENCILRISNQLNSNQHNLLMWYTLTLRLLARWMFHSIEQHQMNFVNMQNSVQCTQCWCLCRRQRLGSSFFFSLLFCVLHSELNERPCRWQSHSNNNAHPHTLMFMRYDYAFFRNSHPLLCVCVCVKTHERRGKNREKKRNMIEWDSTTRASHTISIHFTPKRNNNTLFYINLKF